MNKSLSEMTLNELWELFPVILSEHKTYWSDWYVTGEKTDRNISADTRMLRIRSCGKHCGFPVSGQSSLLIFWWKYRRQLLWNM